jgi:hypothetical protein
MPDSDARRLVTWVADTLKIYPRGQPRAGQTTLGWLVMTLVEEKLSPDDAQTLANIVLTHALIHDQESIKTLQLIALPTAPLQ